MSCRTSRRTIRFGRTGPCDNSRSRRQGGEIVANPVIYGELSVRFAGPAETDAFLRLVEVGLREIPRAALFLAGRAYLRYRRAGGSRTGVLPDFFIGAHAAFEGWPILTRDARRYRTHFPTVRLILPPG